MKVIAIYNQTVAHAVEHFLSTTGVEFQMMDVPAPTSSQEVSVIEPVLYSQPEEVTQLSEMDRLLQYVHDRTEHSFELLNEQLEQLQLENVNDILKSAQVPEEIKELVRQFQN